MAEIVLTEPAVGQIYISRNIPSTYLYVSNITNGIVIFNNVSISDDDRFNISVDHSPISLDDFKKNYELDVSARVVMGGRRKRRNSTKKANENAVENHIAVADKMFQRFMYYLVKIHKLYKIVTFYFLVCSFLFCFCHLLTKNAKNAQNA